MRRALIGAVALFALGASEAGACSCAVQGPPCEVYWTTDVIFRGRAEAIERPAGYANDPARRVVVRFAVLESLKGVSDISVEVTTPTGPASCAIRFAKGREYVVYAWREKGTLRTNACSRSRRVARAQGDLEYSRNIASGGIPLGRISGRVRLFNLDLLTGRYRTSGMRDAAVTLAGPRATVRLMTNPAGEFAVSGLATGAYQLSVDVPGDFRVEMAPSTVELRDARGCVTAEVSVYPEGRVTGRVTDAAGRPIRGLTVELTAEDAAGRVPRPERLQAVTGAEGRYAFTEVPSGALVLGINTRPDLPTFDGRVFYPGVLRAADARIVPVPLGGRVELPDFVVPADITFIEITGFVVDAAGMAVEGARVYLRGPAERDFVLTAPVITDFNGRFRIAALADQEYRLFAERTRPGSSGRIDSTSLIPILAAETAAPLTLTLRSHY